jgi:hypothetical protein
MSTMNCFRREDMALHPPPPSPVASGAHFDQDGGAIAHNTRGMSGPGQL